MVFIVFSGVGLYVLFGLSICFFLKIILLALLTKIPTIVIGSMVKAVFVSVDRNNMQRIEIKDRGLLQLMAREIDL